jgi:hypothetical protein
MPLGVATSMFSAVALGMGVDFGLHWHEGYLLARAAEHAPAEAGEEVGATAGMAILLHTVTLLLGMSVLLLSGVPPTWRLGFLMSLNLVVCSVLTLLLMPALVSVVEAWKERRPR